MLILPNTSVSLNDVGDHYKSVEFIDNTPKDVDNVVRNDNQGESPMKPFEVSNESDHSSDDEKTLNHILSKMKDIATDAETSFETGGDLAKDRDEEDSNESSKD